jgi:D-3-phosphoglycerate dehydrogenase / 2-oxoglutarate reductase
MPTKPPSKNNSCCIFDFDSTLVSIETLDFLIEQSGADAKEIQSITNNAMGGKMSFSDSLRKRFEKANLTKSHIANLQNQISSFISDGVKEFLKSLESTHDFYIISGGFLEIIYPAAQTLGIAKDHCFANELLFEGDKVTGFNHQNILAHDGGKVKVAEEKIIKPNNYQHIFMIGDGYTDLEVSKSNKAITFCGFGGHVVRESVKKEADNFFDDFSQMLSFVREKSQ